MKTVFQILLLLAALSSARTQTLGNGQSWHYQLTDGAALMDDCPACDRVSLWEPMVGSFNLNGTSQPGVFHLTDIAFFGGPESLSFQITGSGTLSYETGEPELTVDMAIRRGFQTDNVLLTKAVPESPRVFPMIGAQANEDPGSISRVYRL